MLIISIVVGLKMLDFICSSILFSGLMVTKKESKGILAVYNALFLDVLHPMNTDPKNLTRISCFVYFID